MKRYNYLSITFILFFTLFVSCNNLTSKPKTESNSVDSVSITGQVTLDINAFPSELNKKTSSRSAMFDDKQTFSFNDGALTVKAVHNVSKYEIQGNVLTESGGIFTYEITLPIPGDWTLIAQGTTQNGITFIGKSVLSVKVSSNGSLIVPDAVPNTYLKPIFKEGEKGSINLKVMNQVPHTESGEYLISWKWGNDKPDGFNDVDVTMSYNTNSKSEAFEFTEVPAGVYKVTIIFYDNNHEELYSCEEWIHVFGGLTTDSWYGEGPQYYSIPNQKTWLALTPEAISFFGVKNDTSSENKSVLYNYLGSDKFSIMLQDGKVEVDENFTFSGITPTASITTDVDTPYFTNVFCYGKNGTIYIAGEATGNGTSNSGVCYHYICEIASNGTTKWYEFTDPDDTTEYKYNSQIMALYYNQTIDCLYVMTIGENLENNTYYPKIFECTLDSTNNTIDAQSYSTIMLNQEPSCFIVQNAYLYVPVYIDGSIKLRCYEFSPLYELNHIYDATILKMTGNNYNIAPNSDNSHIMEFPDMIYLDGYLYLLINDFFVDSYKIYSRGGVLKYNLFTNTYEGLSGFANSDIWENEENMSIQLASKEGYPLYLEQSTDSELIFDSGWDLFSVLNANNQFYGPKKFVYYNSNEVLISDYGYSFSLITKNSKNLIYFDIENHLVNFNLETFTIDAVIDLPADMKFASDQKTSILGPLSNYASTSAYEYKGGTYTSYSSGLRKPYIGRKE